MIKLIFLFLAIFGLCTQCTSHRDPPGLNGIDRSYTQVRVEDGKCFAKCIMPDRYKTHSTGYAVYTGDASIEDVDLAITNVEVSPATTKWVKKRANRNCISSDPNDCLVWCLVQMPAQFQKMKILVDTTQSPNYIWEVVTQEELIEKGGDIEWRTVLCAHEITSNVINQIQDKLRETGFYRGKNGDVMNVVTKSALVSFQKENRLPLGQLDMETLELLEVVLE